MLCKNRAVHLKPSSLNICLNITGFVADPKYVQDCKWNGQSVSREIRHTIVKLLGILLRQTPAQTCGRCYGKFLLSSVSTECGTESSCGSSWVQDVVGIPKNETICCMHRSKCVLTCWKYTSYELG